MKNGATRRSPTIVPDVSDRGADSREPAALLGRHEIGQHGVVERLCGLIRVVGDDERNEHPAERGDGRMPLRRQCRPADRLGSGNRQSQLPEDTDGGAGQTRHDGESDDPWFASPPRVGDGTEHGHGQHERMDETPFPTAYTVFDACRSAISQTEKYSVATFIEKMVFAKSYRAQLARSRTGARSDEGPEVIA